MTVTVAVAASETPRASSWICLLFARFDATPVPAANPITATDRNAMMPDRMKTTKEQPQYLDAFPFSASPEGSALSGEIGNE